MQVALAKFFMAQSRTPTRQRIVNSALELFARHGVTETTTRQIADQAEINEVTLFRHFGTKHGLLLAVMQECLEKYLVLTQTGDSLIMSEISSEGDLARFLRHYIQSSLEAIESVPELVRSLIGEAGQYPLESRQAIALGIAQINQSIANTLRDVIVQTQIEMPLPAIKLANIVNTCILGYAMIMLTSDAPSVWTSREDFISTLVEIIVRDTDDTTRLVDMPAEAVRSILLQAKRQGAREFAIAYVMFGAGLKPEELENLRQDDYVMDAKAMVLRIVTPAGQRFVPINQKILGHRYGSASNNPLTNYLKNRKDSDKAMFLDSAQQPITTADIYQLWAIWMQEHSNTFSLHQARTTWAIEMLLRGMDMENFRIISGFKLSEIQLCQRRLKEKAAIDQAIALDA
jgi:AcrR family transcriptional regulator